MAHWQKRKRIKPISDRRQAQLDEYKIVRIEYLLDHKDCEVEDCNYKSMEIHHMRGRIEKRLVDKDDFLAVCRSCHLHIENNPDWAKAKGYSRSRL